MSYRLFTDACCDLPFDFTEENGIRVLPISVDIGGKTYGVCFDESREDYLDPKTFYDMIRQGLAARTAQINSESFKETFEPVLRAGEDVFYIAFSSALSGTLNSALIAAEELRERYPERRVVAVDSLSASMGQGLLVLLAAREMQKGADIMALKEYVEQTRLKCHHWFTVDDLMYLKRGGRVSGAAAFFGTMLSIKPVLNVDDMGRLIPKEKLQGRKRALKDLVDKMEEKNADLTMPILLSDTDAKEDADIVAALIEKRFGAKVLLRNYISPIIGSHTGPGTVALFFVSDAPRD